MLELDDVKTRLLTEYYNYLDIFDRFKANNLLLYRVYDYRLKFNDDIDQFNLPRNKIYSISRYKLK